MPDMPFSSISYLKDFTDRVTGAAHGVLLIMRDLSVNPAKSNIEHRKVYEYGLINEVISEAETNYDLNTSKTSS